MEHYVLLACCNAVSGRFDEFIQLLCFEIIHAGSLIVDDVEDKSIIRRGKETIHLLFNEAIAINSGTFAYLIPQLDPVLPDSLPKMMLYIFGKYILKGFIKS